MPDPLHSLTQLKKIQSEIQLCRACPKMIGPPVHGPAILSPIFLIGQAPGPHEGKLGRPFAYTAGKTLFRWFEEIYKVDETRFRENVYMAAVARCFPGKGKGSGDRVPDPFEIDQCETHLSLELKILRPKLILAVGKLAIAQMLGSEIFDNNSRLVDVVGQSFNRDFYGFVADVIPLPHPSGLSAWYKVQPGRDLLAQALKLVGENKAWKALFSPIRAS